jgi:hypothetical protein
MIGVIEIKTKLKVDYYHLTPVLLTDFLMLCFSDVWVLIPIFVSFPT